MVRATRTILLTLWPIVLAVLLTWPLISGPGLPLARDLIFVPDQPLTRAAFGFGDASPRAVPLDAVMGLLNVVAPGALWARVLVPGFLVLAGWGVCRLLCFLRPDTRTLSLLVSASLGIWNPWTVERLALGQWALLAGYAALPWLAVALWRWRRDPRWGGLVAIVAWAAVASITPTGGVFALATVATLTLLRSVRSWWPTMLVLALQLPWILAGFLGPAALHSDPQAVEVFMARAGGTGSRVLSLVGLSGIWDRHATPASQDTWWAFGWVALVLIVLVLSVRQLARAWSTLDPERRTGAVRVAVLLGGGFMLAAASSLPGIQGLVQWVVAQVPGGGLLRDSQKFLAPVALALAVAAGRLFDVASRRWSWDPVLSAPVLLVPLVLLPDATTVTWPTVQPVRYPQEFSQIAPVLASDDDCRLLTLPMRSYRAFSWSHGLNGLTSSDPALRWFRCDVVVDDRLVVNQRTLSGESRVVADLVAEMATGQSPAQAAQAAGIGWILVYEDDPLASQLDRSGLQEVLAGRNVTLFRVQAVG